MMNGRVRGFICVGLIIQALSAWAGANVRKPVDDADLKYWLQNMVWHHRFTLEEIRAATGLSVDQVAEALKRFEINDRKRPALGKADSLRVLPYPGGRHPRIGFLEGAIEPQRETKFSVFTPWDPESYVVVDLPEAIWSNLGLAYLAHTHVPTIWSKQDIKLPVLEWKRHTDGTLESMREMPNGVSFGAKVVPGRNAVRMELWLRNGSAVSLSDLRVQNCVMLKGASGFNQLTNSNKIFSKPFVACRNEAGDRWIITGWEPSHRVWGNPPVPCLHSDPKFPDCPPGETRRLRGWLSFYQGSDIQQELRRIERDDWFLDQETLRK